MSGHILHYQLCTMYVDQQDPILNSTSDTDVPLSIIGVNPHHVEDWVIVLFYIYKFINPLVTIKGT